MARVSKMLIEGYRSVGAQIEVTFPAGQPIVLVGENNSGKSNIVRALNLVLGPYWPGSYEPDDNEFFERDRTTPIHIGLYFPEDEPCGERWTELHWRYDESSDPRVSFTGVSPYTEKTWPNNADRDTCSCMLIEADRNLRYQLSYSSKNTFLSRLMRRFHQTLVSKNDLRDELEALFAETKNTFEKLPEFKTFIENLQTDFTQLVSSMTYQLEVDFQAYNPANFFHALDLHASEDGEPRALEEMGTGEQQVLAMAFAHAYAKAFHTGVLLVIEEPEAHLHPLAQAWLASQLAAMSADGLQLVLTTHSPLFVDILNLEGIVLVGKTDGDTWVTQIDRDTLVTHCIATGVDENDIDSDNVLPFYAATASREILEGFFAKLVVLVEGPTESLALPIYLAKAGLDTAKEGIAIIAVHGKGNLAKWRRLFSAYEIPCFVIFDNDASSEDKKGTRRRDALLSVGIDDTNLQDAYIGYEDWITEEQFAVFGSGFEAILRSYFPNYEELESKGRDAGVDSKPFLARYVAENLPVDGAKGWGEMKHLKKALQNLLE